MKKALYKPFYSVLRAKTVQVLVIWVTFWSYPLYSHAAPGNQPYTRDICTQILSEQPPLMQNHIRWREDTQAGGWIEVLVPTKENGLNVIKENDPREILALLNQIDPLRVIDFNSILSEQRELFRELLSHYKSIAIKLETT